MYELNIGDDSRTVDVSKVIHDRIKILFITNQTFGQNLKNEEDFYYLLYCLMLRYITISEEGVRQAGLVQSFFDALNEEFNINYECFAASFAASSNQICSLFYDIEKYFGSCGNFFELEPEMGFYQCSPPLDSLITTMAMDRILEILGRNNNQYPLAFVCLIPMWDNESIRKEGGESKKLELFDDFPIYYKARDSKHLIYNHDIINKKIIYYQYQGKGEMLGVFHAPHIMVLGNDKFRKSFNQNKFIKLLDIFIQDKF